MREVKFRAWIPDLGHDDDFPKRGHMFYWKINWQSQGVSEGEKHGTVMQYTGLKDKNGKEIYEGDILHYLVDEDNGYRTTYLNKEYKVEWEFGGFILREINVKGDYGAVWNMDMTFTPENYNLIGNIYENPELIK